MSGRLSELLESGDEDSLSSESCCVSVHFFSMDFVLLGALVFGSDVGGVAVTVEVLHFHLEVSMGNWICWESDLIFCLLYLPQKSLDYVEFLVGGLGQLDYWFAVLDLN